jgi:hypothetical protein
MSAIVVQLERSSGERLDVPSERSAILVTAAVEAPVLSREKDGSQSPADRAKAFIVNAGEPTSDVRFLTVREDASAGRIEGKPRREERGGRIVRRPSRRAPPGGL